MREFDLSTLVIKTTPQGLVDRAVIRCKFAIRQVGFHAILIVSCGCPVTVLTCQGGVGTVVIIMQLASIDEIPATPVQIPITILGYCRKQRDRPLNPRYIDKRPW